MTDPHARVAGLLEHAAEGDVAPPPLDQLIRRGTARRRRQLWLAAAATIAVIGGSVGGGLAIRSADEVPQPNQSGSPSPAPSSTRPVTTTADQLARGHWAPVARPPISLCPGSTLTAWGDNRLLVLSPMCRGLYTGLHAALYNPRRDLWTHLPDTPGGAEWAGTVGDDYVAVSPANGKAYRIPVPSVSTGAEVTWSELPDLPERSEGYLGDNVTTFDDSIVVAGTGAGGTGVWQLADGAWRPLPRLPASSPSEVQQVSVTALAGELYAFDAVGDAGPTRGGSMAPHVLRLAGDSWVEQPRADGLPLLVTHAEPFDQRLWVMGSNCPLGASCPFTPWKPVGIYDPADGDYVDLSHAGAYDVGRIGEALVSYNGSARVQGGGLPLRPGDTSVWGPGLGWLDADSSGKLVGFAATAATPAGFVVLVDDGDSGGRILRPQQ